MLRIYKASAGSGKTYTLVKEYLRLAFEYPTKYRHILAITFTNKAANEMKDRIIDALDGIAKGEAKYKDLTTELCTALKKTEAALRPEAGLMLRHMLHNYADVSISTIDSFVHRVVRAFAHDLYLPMNFEIEMDSAKLLAEAVDLLLDRLNESDAQVTQSVIDFAEDKIEEGRSWNVDFEIKKLGRELFVDDALPYIQKLAFISFDTMREARASLHARVNSFEKKLYDEGRLAFDLIISNGLTEKDFYQGSKGIFGFFNKYASGQFPKDVRGNSYVSKSIVEDKWAGGKANESTLHDIDVISHDLIRHYNKIVDIWEKDGKDYHLAKLLIKNFYAFILLADLQKLMEEIKREENVLHIGDFQHKVFEIVKEQDAPVIYERIGDRYDNILIDEFQDTSVIQWRNLLPLVENAQFKNVDSLIVGDSKQAIYRFRGGESEQFIMLPKVYGSETDDILLEREVAIGNYGAEVEVLERNYRSAKEIIDFNSDLYKAMQELPEMTNKQVYADYFQLSNSKQGGFVSIEFLEEGDEEDEETTIHDNRCRRVQEIVNDCMQRGYSARDVAVLTRSNANASVIAAFLVEQGIKVVSPESLLIHQSPKVRLLLSVFAYLDRRDNHIARLEMMHYTHLLLKKGIRYEGVDFKTAPELFEAFLSEEAGVAFNSVMLSTGRLTDLVQQLIRVFKLNDNDPFLQFFTDEILLYAARYGNSIHDFLIWWDGVKHKKSIIYPESMDAVRIMTIHKSKGLQFPVVILADAADKKKLQKNFFWVGLQQKWLPQLDIGLLPVEKAVLETEYAPLYQREDEQSFLDMLNLLYVGTTRPEDALYILSTKPAKETTGNTSVTALLVSFLKQIERWEDFTTYTFGNPDFRKAAGDKPVALNHYQATPAPMEEWQSLPLKIKVRAELFWSDTTIGKIERGNVLHEALKRVKTEGDEDMVVRRMMAEGLVDGDSFAELLHDVKQVVGHSAISRFFKPGVKAITERAILKAGESTHIPDRVVWADDGIVVIDYKTGKPRAEHKTQLQAYAKLLEETGLIVTGKIIFYTVEQKAEVVE